MYNVVKIYFKHEDFYKYSIVKGELEPKNAPYTGYEIKWSIPCTTIKQARQVLKELLEFINPYEPVNTPNVHIDDSCFKDNSKYSEDRILEKYGANTLKDQVFNIVTELAFGYAHDELYTVLCDRSEGEYQFYETFLYCCDVDSLRETYLASFFDQYKEYLPIQDELVDIVWDKLEKYFNRYEYKNKPVVW